MYHKKICISFQIFKQQSIPKSAESSFRRFKESVILCFDDINGALVAVYILKMRLKRVVAPCMHVIIVHAEDDCCTRPGDAESSQTRKVV